MSLLPSSSSSHFGHDHDHRLHQHQHHDDDDDNDSDSDSDSMNDSNNDNDNNNNEDNDYKFKDNPKDVEEYLTTTTGGISTVPLTYRDVHNLRNEPKYIDTQMDDLLSKELLNLSLKDRNAINEEIHGVECLAIEETPDMLSIALDNLSIEISMLSDTQKIAYNKSQQHINISNNNKTSLYINTSDFRLRFLRCELFDCKKAALRMVNFLDLLLEIFGDFVLRRPIQITDFNRDEMQIFRLGLLQLLPYRDRSGRRIFASVGGFGLRTPLITRVSYIVIFILLYLFDFDFNFDF
jgi:hypothetical protein